MANGFNPEVEGINSKFNAGILQMTRIHKLQDQINEYNQNLLAWNEEKGNWNYKLKFNSLCSLYQEAKPKLSSKDQIFGDGFVDKLQNYFKICQKGLNV